MVNISFFECFAAQNEFDIRFLSDMNENLYFVFYDYRHKGKFDMRM